MSDGLKWLGFWLFLSVAVYSCTLNKIDKRENNKTVDFPLIGKYHD